MEAIIWCIDVGNTRSKVARFQHNKLIDTRIFDTLEELHNALHNITGYTSIIVSDVSGKATSLLRELPQKNIHLLSASSPHGLKLHYQQAHMLGADRIAAVCGARSLFPQSNILVLDAGTCLTIDFCDDLGNFKGGSISPGWQMRLRAMHYFTGKLPDLTARMAEEWMGNHTESCMQSGAFYGMLYEINGAIERYEAACSPLNVVITGGDSALFGKHTKKNIFAVPELVLIGLNEIAKHVFTGV